ncbi:putative ribonuclease H-like domain-containing protein [Tanacetum coccineum]|uniref:Ribonuclease H-like domain-containing protein n=1 Tax=Tanacetum coccineum TaxID=301880 RepID=A0ABQ4XN68_9ASTR
MEVTQLDMTNPMGGVGWSISTSQQDETLSNVNVKTKEPNIARNMNQDSSRKTVNVEETSSKAMVAIDGGLKEQLVFYKKNEAIFCEQLAVLKRDISYKKSELSMLKSELEKLKQEKESNQLKIEKFNNASKSLDKLIGSQIPDKSRKGLGFVSYNAVPPPPTGLFSPPNLDLSNFGLEEFQQLEFEGYGPKTSKNVSEDTSNEVRESPDAPMVEKLVSDDKLEKKTVFPTVAKIEFVRPKQREKPVRKPVKYAEMYRSQSPRGNQRNWNNQKSQQLGSNFVMYNKACFVCGGFDHVQAHCNYHQRERVESRNNYTRVKYNYSAKKSHPNAYRNMVPRAVLIKIELRSLNTARLVTTAHPKTIVYSARPMSHLSKSAQSTVKRPKAVNTTRPNSAVVNAVRVNQVNAVKASACWVWRPTNLISHPQKEDQGYVNSGCSRHMTRNMSYLSEFKEFDKGYVTFGGGVKGGKITGKELLKLMCDIKNSVLFTDTRCFVLSPNFKLADESQATLNESMLWHRRLGKQHKASCKSKIQNSITQPLFMLHMDLFGPTFMSSLMNNKYYLVVTDDYSRFNWVFFLATNDETSGILKSFINEIENLVDKKVKIIRCDNETEFKNKVMSEFCEQKGIKREFSVARTPQQNGVAERRNKTLIENRVLIVKPHNKTPYELFRGRTSALSFMRPFGCHVTILNTLDYLGIKKNLDYLEAKPTKPRRPLRGLDA